MHDPCKRHVSHRNAVRILRGGALCHAQNFGDHYATLLVTPTFLSLKLTFLSLKLTFLRVARPAAAAVAPSACALSGKWDTCMHAAQQHARCRCCFQCVFSVFSVCFQCVFSVFSVYNGARCARLLSQPGSADGTVHLLVLVSRRFTFTPLQNCLFTPELQWQSRGQRRI
jgi:hypothetical protein